jgi:hypothetical protein
MRHLRRHERLQLREENVGIAVVIEYGREFRDGRVIVGKFKSKEEALRYVSDKRGRDLRILSLNPSKFEHSVPYVHDLANRTVGDITSVEKVEGGLRCCGAFWPFDRRGTGLEGRPMPGDIWLWASVAEHYARLRRH